MTIQTQVSAKQTNGEGTIRSMVESMKVDHHFVPEQERNFDQQTPPTNTNPYSYRGMIELDGKLYSRWS
jgi:hypothetical protein